MVFICGPSGLITPFVFRGGRIYSKFVGVTLCVGFDCVCGWWLECSFPLSCSLIPTSSVDPIVISNQTPLPKEEGGLVNTTQHF